MNAVELTGNDPRPGAGSSSSSNSSTGSSGAVPDEIVPFYPITFQEQVMVMCKLPTSLTRNDTL